MIKAYQKIINRMKAAGLGLKTHWLDNKASKAYMQCIHQNGIDAQTSPARQPQKQSGRVGDSKVQTPLYFNPERRGKQIPAVIMVRTPQANGTYRESPQAIKHCAKNTSFCPHPRPTRLHEKAIRANRMRSPNPRQAQKQTDMGHPHRSRIQPWHVNGAPPML